MRGMFQIETKIRKIGKSDIELKLNTIPENADSANSFWSCEKQFGKEVHFTKASPSSRDKQFTKTVYKDHFI